MSADDAKTPDAKTSYAETPETEAAARPAPAGPESHNEKDPHHRHGKPHKTRHLPKRAVLLVAGAALLVAGAGGGAAVVAIAKPSVQMAPLVPVAISAMPADSLVTVKGTVAEVFGNKFVLQDASGRALIETGRAGEGGRLVAPNEAVTVQGRFEDGFLRAAFLVRADGKTETLHVPGGPKHGPRHGPGHDRERGPDRAERGPDRTPGPDAPDGPSGRL